MVRPATVFDLENILGAEMKVKNWHTGGKFYRFKWFDPF